MCVHGRMETMATNYPTSHTHYRTATQVRKRTRRQTNMHTSHTHLTNTLPQGTCHPGGTTTLSVCEKSLLLFIMFSLSIPRSVSMPLLINSLPLSMSLTYELFLFVSLSDGISPITQAGSYSYGCPCPCLS